MLIELCEQIGDRLRKDKLLLSVAESCTGGLVAAAITDIPGSSAWFDTGFVTYSNEAKMTLLGVRSATLQQHGAVSEATAIAMAEGAKKNSRAQIALATTGIAGPGGGSEDKPVGMVCFAWALEHQVSATITQHFIGDRQSVRRQATTYALQELLALLA